MLVDDALYRTAAAHGFPCVMLVPGAYVAAGLTAWGLFIENSTAGERAAARAALGDARAA